MARNQGKSRRGHRWLKWTAIALLAVLLVLGVVVAISLHRVEPTLRAVIVDKLSEHFHAHVELDSFHISLVNGLWAEGKGLRIWPPAQLGGVAVPGGSTGVVADITTPLIALDDFRFHPPLEYKRGKPIRIARVELHGLNIDIPPKTHFAHPAVEATPAAAPTAPSTGLPIASLFQFVVESIVCSDAHLTIETSKPGKLPLVFDITRVTFTGVNISQPSHFEAELTNPRPQGTIKTSGIVGPWASSDPGETPISGEYRFEHADLGVFKEIAGIMESTGKYTGVLRELTVDGVADVPDFRLTRFGTALPLKTQFHALVDGTNGDTRLQHVDAVLGQSHFVTAGEIVRQQAQMARGKVVRPAGHEVALNLDVDRGRIEDFLRLASKDNKAMLTGDVVVKSTIEIPPGTAPAHERLKLNGNFTLNNAEFSSDKIQNWVKQLSLRGQGDARAAKHGGGVDVSSAMQSDFTMADGTIALPDLRYMVPGAEVDLNGQYGVERGTLDFRGYARTEATVSQMVGGWKGMLLKPADRFFKKDGAGTQVPIRVTGTRESPRFSVELGKLKKTVPATPGQPQ